MDLNTALIVCAGCAALAAFFGWRGARPWDLRGGPRMLPYGFLMLVAATAAIFAGVYALDLSGLIPAKP
ncbi:MAG: hypothetical protein JSR45_14210 [Proteobacteria bacterium]|nr:hypothetical protein [Pseudomonadota bacterium]